jgi:hypothetical protein
MQLRVQGGVGNRGPQNKFLNATLYLDVTFTRVGRCYIRSGPSLLMMKFGGLQLTALAEPAVLSKPVCPFLG